MELYLFLIISRGILKENNWVFYSYFKLTVCFVTSWLSRRRNLVMQNEGSKNFIYQEVINLRDFLQIRVMKLCSACPFLPLLQLKLWFHCLNNWHLTLYKFIYNIIDIIGIGHCVNVRYTMYWLDTFIHCNMTTILVLANNCITSHNYHFFLVIRITDTLATLKLII